MEETVLLDTLEERLTMLERKIFGEDLSLMKAKSKNDVPILTELKQIDNQLNRAVANRDNITSIFERIDELNDCLKLDDDTLLSGEAKANALLAAEPSIRHLHSLLKEIDVTEFQKMLTNESIGKLESFRGDLAKLRLGEMRQQDRLQEVRQKCINIEEVMKILRTD